MRRLLIATLLLYLPPAFPSDGLANAYFLCDIFEKTELSTECTASNATSTVDVIINTSVPDAIQVCSVIVDKMVQMRRSFGNRWQLRIFAPDRADEPLAACALK